MLQQGRPVDEILIVTDHNDTLPERAREAFGQARVVRLLPAGGRVAV